MSGPLAGRRIIEIAGIGPGPFAAMLLADMGAEVVRVDRAGAVRGPGWAAADLSPWVSVRASARASVRCSTGWKRTARTHWTSYWKASRIPRKIGVQAFRRPSWPPKWTQPVTPSAR